MKEKIGFVYVLTNTSMPGIVKIGLTKNIKDRIINLSSRTAIPTPFKLYRAIEVKDMFEVEKQLHNYFKKQRTNSQREFFTISPEETDPLFDHYEKTGAKNFDKELLPKKKEKELIDDKVKDFRKKYQKNRQIFAIKTNFRIVRYYLKGWQSLVERGIDILKNNKNPIPKEEFKRMYINISGKKEVDHNWASHSKYAGIIDVSKTHYSLTDNGLEFKKKPSYENFVNSLKKILKNNTLEFYPYKSSFKILEKVKILTNIEFLWGIYIMKDTSNNEIEKCIKRIQNIRKVEIDYEKFNNLKDLYYIISTINDLNFKYKDQIEICQQNELKKKFEVVDFVGLTLSRLSLEFEYFKNHLTLIWPEKYSKDKMGNLFTN